MAFAILCSCGEVTASDDRERAWEALNAHQQVCGREGFEAYESAATAAEAVQAVRHNSGEMLQSTNGED